MRGKALNGIDEFAFERRPEAFDERVIEARAFACKAWQHLVCFKFVLIGIRGVLAPPVA